MAGDYIFDPITVDWEGLQLDAFDYIRSRWPDWKPNDANLETWIIGACARIVAEAMAVAADVPPAIFKYFGATIVGLPPVPGVPATVLSNWTLLSNPAGRTIEAGTIVGLEASDGTLVPFEVVSDTVVVSPTLVANGVLLRAQDDGASGNDIGGAGEDATLIDAIAWVGGIVTGSLSANGSDEETDDEYMDRLSRRLTLLTPRPILPSDFSTLAVDIARENGYAVRALALDGYKTSDNTYNNDRYVTVALADLATGAAVPAAASFVDAELQAQREVNFVVEVIGPHLNPVAVTFIGKSYPGYDPADVEVRAEAAVTDYLQAYNSGINPSETGEWVDLKTLYRQRISQVLDQVDGFSHWTTLTVGINGGAQTTAESFALTGPAALTTPGAVAGTVTAP